MMGYQSGGLDIALLILARAFKLYFDSSQDKIMGPTTQLDPHTRGTLLLLSCDSYCYLV